MSFQNNTTNAITWEVHLTNLAYEALQDCVPQALSEEKKKRLDEAYAHCDQLTNHHSKTFWMASRLLPPARQRAVQALYAFCRVSDDLVDRMDGNHPEILQEWKNKSLNHFSYLGGTFGKASGIHPGNGGGSPDYSEDLVALAWADTCHNFNIPCMYAEQLINGVALDMQKNRYDTFDELAGYCYGVACTVGLMAMHIIGYEGPQAIPYAVRLGVALQLTNILRDVGEDWSMGRLYLPKEELDAFGITEEYIQEERVDARWRDFMRFQIERARELYRESRPGVKLLDSRGRFAIMAAADLYEGILDDIEAHDYQVFSRRSYVSKAEKLRRLPVIWFRSKF
jgi:15-cis-phytoene synthase